MKFMILKSLLLLPVAMFLIASVDAQSPGANQFDDPRFNSCVEPLKLRKFEDARIACLELAKEYPDEPLPLKLAANSLMWLKRYAEASDLYFRIIKLVPNDAEAYFLKGESDRLRDARPEAIAAYSKAIELSPKEAIGAYLGMGDVLVLDKSRYRDAVAAYGTALQLAFDYASMILMRSANQAKDDAEREFRFRLAMDADPKHMLGRFDLGRLFVTQGKLAEAREVWNGRTAEDRTMPALLTLLTRAERLRDAKAEFEKNPNDPVTILKMGAAVMDGYSWVSDGRQEKALVYFRKALELKPAWIEAQFMICKAYVEIAYTDRNANPDLDRELEKLRKMDAARAAEIDAYRKTFSSGLTSIPSRKNP